jgi:alpha-glucosidase
MTNWDARRLDIPLAFLGEGRYTAEIYADAPDADRFPKKVETGRKEVDAAMTLPARLAPGGGWAARFTPR